MSRAIKIDPITRTVEEIDIPATHDAVRPIVGQKYFDYARLGSGVVALVDDEGLKRGPGQSYWRFKKSRVMMAGIAVLFSLGDEDLEALDDQVTVEQTKELIEWIGNSADAEQLIRKGIIDRPATTINGEPIWTWRPEGNEVPANRRN